MRIECCWFWECKYGYQMTIATNLQKLGGYIILSLSQSHHLLEMSLRSLTKVRRVARCVLFSSKSYSFLSLHNDNNFSLTWNGFYQNINIDFEQNFEFKSHLNLGCCVSTIEFYNLISASCAPNLVTTVYNASKHVHLGFVYPLNALACKPHLTLHPYPHALSLTLVSGAPFPLHKKSTPCLLATHTTIYSVGLGCW